MNSVGSGNGQGRWLLLGAIAGGGMLIMGVFAVVAVLLFSKPTVNEPVPPIDRPETALLREAIEEEKRQIADYKATLAQQETALSEAKTSLDRLDGDYRKALQQLEPLESRFRQLTSAPWESASR